MSNARRRTRQLEVISQRLGTVRIAAEHLHHRHNVSALLRTADAVGIHRVHLVGQGPFHAARGPSKGAGNWLELHQHPTPEEAVQAIRDAGFALWVADLASPPVAPAEVPVDRPICVWFGAELVGVAPVARAAADGVVTVPMRGFAQSLNISVAAAIVMHDVAARARELGDGALLPVADRQRILADWFARDEAELDASRARQDAIEALGAGLSDDDVLPEPR